MSSIERVSYIQRVLYPVWKKYHLFKELFNDLSLPDILDSWPANVYSGVYPEYQVSTFTHTSQIWVQSSLLSLFLRSADVDSQLVPNMAEVGGALPRGHGHRCSGRVLQYRGHEGTSTDLLQQ